MVLQITNVVDTHSAGTVTLPNRHPVASPSKKWTLDTPEVEPLSGVIEVMMALGSKTK
jgi:hypothetical protein